MKTLIAAFSFLSALPLLAYNLTTDDTSVSWAGAGLPYSGSDVLISGPADRALSNSWVYLDADLSMDGKTLKVNQGAAFKAEGNYALTVGNLILSNANDSRQGTASMLFKGDSASDRLVLNIKNTGTTGSIGCDTNQNSTLFELAGNVTLNAVNESTTFGLGYVSGLRADVLMRVCGQNNVVVLNSLGIGAVDATGTANLQIEGSTHSVTASNAFRFRGALGTGVDGVKGGSITFKADSGGVSSLNIGDLKGSDKVEISGVIFLDLADFVFTSATEDFHLISTSNAYALSAIESWVAAVEGGAGLFAVTGGPANSEWSLRADSDGLWATVAAIPEPGACAAAFGLLSLATAACRRRK